MYLFNIKLEIFNKALLKIEWVIINHFFPQNLILLWSYYYKIIFDLTLQVFDV